jgi:hypothetical protein
MAQSMRELAEQERARRPWEPGQPVTPENDPLRHLTPEERNDILSKIVPASDEPITVRVSDKGRCGGSEEIRWNPSPINDPQMVETAPCPGCPDCQPDNPQGIEEKWTIPICECGVTGSLAENGEAIFDQPCPDENPGNQGHRNIRRIEVVPLSRLREVEAERDEAQATIRRMDTATIKALKSVGAWDDPSGSNGVVSNIKRLASQRDKLRDRLTSPEAVEAAREGLPLELPTARFNYKPTEDEAAQAVAEERRIARELLENVAAAFTLGRGEDG